MSDTNITSSADSLASAGSADGLHKGKGKGDGKGKGKGQGKGKGVGKGKGKGKGTGVGTGKGKVDGKDAIGKGKGSIDFQVRFEAELFTSVFDVARVPAGATFSEALAHLVPADLLDMAIVDILYSGGHQGAACPWAVIDDRLTGARVHISWAPEVNALVIRALGFDLDSSDATTIGQQSFPASSTASASSGQPASMRSRESIHGEVTW